jgi:protein CpxP
MSNPTRRPVTALPLTRSLAFAALMSAPLVALPLTMVRAEPATAIQLAQTTQAAVNPADAKAETVEQRIDTLHAQLKVTPDLESKWNSVAQAMRDNAANMDKLVAEKRQTAPQSMTAVDDLQTYQQFAQQHLDGLKNLTSAFKSLYSAMNDGQKKNADQVFANFNHNGTPQPRG